MHKLRNIHKTGQHIELSGEVPHPIYRLVWQSILRNACGQFDAIQLMGTRPNIGIHAGPWESTNIIIESQYLYCLNL